jgi:hypothetical protein
MTEALTVFPTVQDPGDETENAVEEAFDDLGLRLGGIGEVVGWEALERALAGGRATLFGSDSEGNQRARPSTERPLSAKAA